MKSAPRLVLVAALGCAGHPASPSARAGAPVPKPPTSASLDELLRGDLAADHAFAWSARRLLVWNDFQGSPPSEGSEAAKTSYTLYSMWKCSGDAFEVRVIAGFRPLQSWVKAIVLNDTIQRRTVLLHEQTHFDLAEVHARRMQKALGDLARPCANTDREMQDLMDRLSEAEKDEQRRYDAETDHGLRADRQATWSRNVNLRLDRLRTPS